MISEYVNLQIAVFQRCTEIGRVLQQTHYAMAFVPFPAAVPALSNITETEIAILVGMNAEQEWVCIHIPISLFESGTLADVRVWSYHQNTDNEKRVRLLEDKDSEVKRSGEISMLKELVAKYPEALNE